MSQAEAMTLSMKGSHALVYRTGAALLLCSLTAACSEKNPIGPEPNQPALALSDSSAVFGATGILVTPATRSITVLNDGAGAVTGLAANVSYSAGQPAGWLAATLSGTTTPATLTLAATAVEEPGTFSATVAVEGTAVDARVMHVTMTVEPGTPPTITITSPSRAAMLQHGGWDPADVRITGQACHDTAPITNLVVNGTAVPVSGNQFCEPFDVMQSAMWGMSMISVHAQNAYGRDSEVVQSYLRSPSFMDTQQPAERIPNAIQVRLNQGPIDGQPGGLDDLGRLIELRLAPSSVTALMPNPLYTDDIDICPFSSSTHLAITRTGALTWNNPWVDLTATPWGLELDTWMSNISIPVRVSFTGCLGNTTSLNSTIRAASAIAEGTATGSIQNAMVVDVTSVDVNSPSLDVGSTFAYVVATAIARGLNAIVQLFSGKLNDFLTDMVSEYLNQYIEAFEIAETIDVGGHSIEVTSVIDSIEFGDRYLTTRFAASAAPSQPSGTTPAFGAISLNTSTGPAYGQAPSFGMGIALHGNLFNQALWTMWRAGSFDNVPVEASGVSLEFTALLPPIITTDATASTFGIQWGDLEYEALLDPTVLGLPAGSDIPVSGFASVNAIATIGYDSVNHRLLVSGTSAEVHVQVDAPGTIIDTDAIEDHLASIISQSTIALLEQSISALSLPTIPFRFNDVTVSETGGWLLLTGNADAM